MDKFPKATSYQNLTEDKTDNPNTYSITEFVVKNL